MSTDRRTATIVGVLYIIGTAAGVASMVVTRGLLDAADYLNRLASHSSPAMMAALLVLVMGVALAMVSAFMFPILKRHNEALAIGYVIFRGALETLTYIAVAMCWLLLVLVARQYESAGPEVASQLNALGTLLVGAKSLPLLAVQDIFFSVGALMFYGLLYRARLIPRWLSGWGIVGVIGYLAAGVMGVFGTHPVPLLMPLALQEMVMAVWLIAKGFSSPAVAPVRDLQPLAA